MAGGNAVTQLTDRDLRNLAPLELANHRQDRFRGDDNRSVLSEYKEADREILSQIYQALEGVFEDMLQGNHDPEHLCRVLSKHAHQREPIVAATGQLGIATLKTDQSRHLAQVIHDIRGARFCRCSSDGKCWRCFPTQPRGYPRSFFYSVIT